MNKKKICIDEAPTINIHPTEVSSSRKPYKRCPIRFKLEYKFDWYSFFLVAIGIATVGACIFLLSI